MILKQKAHFTGRELCDLEGYIFPMLSAFDGDDLARKQAFISLVDNSGQDIVKLCYTDDNGLKIEQINSPFRIQLMTDVPSIIGFIFDTEGESGKPKPKPTPRKIKR